MNNMNYGAHEAQRVAVFFDTQNLYHSAKSNYRSNVNYQELLSRAVAGRQLVRAFAYVIRSDEGSEEKFFDAVQEMGIEIRVKDLQVFHTGVKKADWDVGIAVDMIRLTEKVDVIVLASGDGDFLEVIRYCQSRGVRVEVMAFDKTVNNKLAEEADLFIDLGQKAEGFLFSGRNQTSRKSSARRGSGFKAEISYDNGLDNESVVISNPNLNLPDTSKMNLPAFFRLSAEDGEGKSYRQKSSANNAKRTVSKVIGLPARPNTPYASPSTANLAGKPMAYGSKSSKPNASGSSSSRRTKNFRKVSSVRSLNSKNVFGNNRPGRKKSNNTRSIDEQKINWFGRNSY